MRIVALPALALTLALSGCVVYPGSRGRTVIHEVKVVDPPPPPPRVVVVKGSRPAPDHVWVPGHHTHRNGCYVWVKGHWEKPPRHKRVWVSGRFKRTRSGGVWIAGHWR